MYLFFCLSFYCSQIFFSCALFFSRVVIVKICFEMVPEGDIFNSRGWNPRKASQCHIPTLKGSIYQY